MSQLKTTLITGSSEGIGRSFAEIYAKNGHDLVLVARNAAKLMDFASELKAKYAVDVHVFALKLKLKAGVQQHDLMTICRDLRMRIPISNPDLS